MRPHSTAPTHEAQERPYKPASIALIVIKAVVIAVVLVGLASVSTRVVLALMPS